MEEPWTILELAELAADALAAGQPVASSGGAGSSGEAGLAAGRRAGSSSGGGVASGAARPAPVRANGRVRDVPNERLVRWYVTVGLVDPPLSRRGRVARYGRRHLLQLVAVKRRQSEGRSLAEIQAELTGATDETLAAVARVPDIQQAPEAPPAAPARFWARQAGQLAPDADQHVPENGRPDEAMPDPDQQEIGTGRVDSLIHNEGRPTPDAGRAAAGADRQDRATPDAGRAAAGADRQDRATPDAGRAAAGAGRAGRGTPGGGGGIVHGVRLAPGVTLLLEGADREPGAEDVTEIVNAARPLLEELAERG